MAKKDAQGNLHDDINGRFTSKNGTAALEKKYNDDLAPVKKSETLTKKEFAVWYKKLGEIKRGGYVDKMSNGNKLIPIGNKIVVTSGTYEKPKAKMVFEFENEERMFDYVNRKRKK